MIASTACRVAGGLPGSSRTRRTCRGGGDGHLAADRAAHPRIGLEPGHVRFDLQGDRAHRQDPALRTPRIRATSSSAATGSPSTSLMPASSRFPIG